MRKVIYNINDLSAILGFTVPAIHAHLARKNYEAVPRPFHLGRRLAWSTEAVHQWLDMKINQPEGKK
ncbi:MAG: helix-turn-helix transcriptional regulator [Desulfovibrionaceae bacterium]